MRSKKLYLFIPVAIVAGFFLVTYLIDKTQFTSINGTYRFAYSINSEKDEVDSYIIFSKPKYYEYRQFGSVFEGSYEKLETHLFEAKINNNVKLCMLSDDKLYVIDSSSQSIEIFTKISKIPIFINVTAPSEE